MEVIDENRKKRSHNEPKNMSSPETTISDISLDFFDVSTEISFKNQTNKPFDENLCQLNHNSVDISSELVPIVRPLTDYNNNLTETEGKVLTELMSTEFDSFKCPTDSVPTITSEVSTFSEAMALISFKWENDIRKLIKNAKRLIAFNNICNEDQYSLFKYGAIEITYLLSILCYEQQNECIIVHLVSLLQSTKVS